jgi:hypothetical protein
VSNSTQRLYLLEPDDFPSIRDGLELLEPARRRKHSFSSDATALLQAPTASPKGSCRLGPNARAAAEEQRRLCRRLGLPMSIDAIHKTAREPAGSCRAVRGSYADVASEAPIRVTASY